MEARLQPTLIVSIQRIMYLIERVTFVCSTLFIHFVRKFHEQGVHRFRVFLHGFSTLDISIELLFFQRHGLLIDLTLALFAHPCI